MNYEEMVKLAYEDIMGGIDKEAANALGRNIQQRPGAMHSEFMRRGASAGHASDLINDYRGAVSGQRRMEGILGKHNMSTIYPESIDKVHDSLRRVNSAMRTPASAAQGASLQKVNARRMQHLLPSVKTANEDVNYLDKEAANRLFGDGGAQKLLESRMDSLSRPAKALDKSMLSTPSPQHAMLFKTQKDAYFRKNPAAANAYANDLSGYGGIRNCGRAGDIESAIGAALNGDKSYQKDIISALSNHKRSLYDIKEDAYKLYSYKKAHPKMSESPNIRNLAGVRRPGELKKSIANTRGTGEISHNLPL